MKRIMRTAAAALLSLGLLAQPALAAESKIHVVLQGAPVQFEAGAEPVVENNRTLVPLRMLSEKLGFMVEWEPNTQQITLSKFPTKVVLWVGKAEAQVNGKPFTLEVAPKMVGSRVFVPVRFISEQLGASVYWNGAKNEIRVTPKGQSDPEAVAFLKANAEPAAPAAAANQQLHANLWFNVTEPGKKPQEGNLVMNLQVQGKEVFGDLALSAPLMGANLPLLNAEFAVRNGNAWVKLTGGMLAAELGKEMQGWQPLGPLTGVGTPPNLGDKAPKFTPEELQKVGQRVIDQILVTFGPSVVKDGKTLTRLNLDMSKVDFFGIVGELMGEPAPADLGVKIENAKMSLLIEEGTTLVRAVEFGFKIGDEEMQIEVKLNATVDAATAPITWPADLPELPPAKPSPLEPTTYPPFFPTPTPVPGGNA